MPVATSDAGTWRRRVTLDLAGRILTEDEAVEVSASLDQAARNDWVLRLVHGPEFALHFGTLLDQWIQQRHAGDAAFVGYLRHQLAQGRGWDAIFRQLLLGPWEGDVASGASRYLSKRVKNLDALTADTSQVFFGVDITCARCHDHPLIGEWTQHHYYGLAAFFNRTVETKKNSGVFEDKPDGEVTFQSKSAGQQTAPMMFLTGVKFASVAKQNRREQLVSAALAERTMLSRAVVNRLWGWFFGRALVEPVDQMHPENPSCVPGLLEFLADDFAAHGYDLRHTAAAMCCCRAYQRSSRHSSSAASTADDTFAIARLRPLTRQQWALSAVIAAGAAPRSASSSQADHYLAAEKRAAELLVGLDPTSDRYQASAAEALFLSNHPSVQTLTQPAEQNLAARLLRVESIDERLNLAFRSTLNRQPTSAERHTIAAWWTAQPSHESAAAALVWSLLTSAEFRFNH